MMIGQSFFLIRFNKFREFFNTWTILLPVGILMEFNYSIIIYFIYFVYIFKLVLKET